MIRVFKWCALTLIGMLGTFYILYAMYCKLYDVEPANLLAVYHNFINTNTWVEWVFIEIPSIPKWEVGQIENWYEIWKLLSYIVNILSGFVNSIIGIFNFIQSIGNMIFKVVSFVTYLISSLFSAAFIRV